MHSFSQDNYLPAYPNLTIGIVQIISYCILGTVVDTSVRLRYELFLFITSLINFLKSSQSNDIREKISSFDWYLLPKQERRNYAMLLHNSQEYKKLFIAGVSPLNLQTCVSVS